MDLFVGWTYIVGKMLHYVQRMHQLWTLNVHKQQTVVGLLDSVELLDKGYIVYLDNFYNSFELQSELYSRDTYTAGTLRKNHRGNSKAGVNATLNKGEAVYRRNGPVLCLKWCQKREV